MTERDTSMSERDTRGPSLARVAGPFLGELSLGRFGPGSPTLGAAALALLAAAVAATLVAPVAAPSS